MPDFNGLIERAERGEVFQITRAGKPTAVLIGAAEYERLRYDLDLLGRADA